MTTETTETTQSSELTKTKRIGESPYFLLARTSLNLSYIVIQMCCAFVDLDSSLAIPLQTSNTIFLG